MSNVRVFQRFWDRQLNEYSCQKSLRDLCNMCIDDMNWEEGEESWAKTTVKNFIKGQLSESDMKEVLDFYEYDVIERKLVTGFGKKYKGGIKEWKKRCVN